jgi:hypothetical protein
VKRTRTLTIAVVAVVATALISTGVTVAVTAGATGTNTTYYACLANGKLTKVGTAAPTCASPATAISWNQTGPQGPAGNTILSGSTAPSSTIGLVGNFYLETTNHKLYGPATRTCSPLPCHTVWGAGISLVGPKGPQGPPGQGDAYQTTGSGTVEDDGYSVLAELVLPDGYFTLSATAGTVSNFGENGLVCNLAVNYDNGIDGGIDTEYNSTPGEIALSGSVYYDPAQGTGYALVWCQPNASNDSGETASVTVHLTATQVSSVVNQ